MICSIVDKLKMCGSMFVDTCLDKRQQEDFCMATTKLYRKGMHAACKLLIGYINRHRSKLEQNIGTDGVDKLLAVIDAVNTMIIFLETAFPGDYIPQ